MRTNPETGIHSGYYRLVESYRNSGGRVCYRTILNAGYLDELNTDQLNLIQKILTTKVTHHDQSLFKLPFTDDTTVIHYVEKFYDRMVAEKRIDVLVEKQEKKPSKSGKNLQTIDINSIRNKDVREVGAEWLLTHLHLGLLAYWLVNPVRHQLKKEGIHSGWREIVRTMNTRKAAVTTLAQNIQDEVILIRRCSEPTQPARKLYDALKFKYSPFVKRKSVVHKSKLENCQFIDKQYF